MAIPDTAAIDQRIGRADYILLTHGHYVHLLDAPYIVICKATNVGNESVGNIARAYGVPDEQIITIRGGDDFEFKAFSLRVVPSLHTALRPRTSLISNCGYCKALTKLAKAFLRCCARAANLFTLRNNLGTRTASSLAYVLGCV